MDRNHIILRNLFLGLFVICLILIPHFIFTAGNAVYLAMADTGSANGLDCADAKAVVAYYNTPGNWSTTPTGIQIGPGTTVHFCGTFNVPLNNGSQNVFLFAQGSGTAGNPITHVWEPGATFTSAAMYIAFSTKSGPALGGTAQTNLIYDGNCLVGGLSPGKASSPCATASITNTANGSSLANQLASGAIYAPSCTNCEFKNLTMTNIYVNVPGTNSLGQNTFCIELDFAQHGKMHDNVCDGAAFGYLSQIGSGDTDYEAYNNFITHVNQVWFPAGNGINTTPPALLFHDNHVKDLANWDVMNIFHHDGFGPYTDNINCTTNFIDTAKIYNNIFDGNQGASVTAWVFANCGLKNTYIFNNIFFMCSTCGGYAIETGLLVNADFNYIMVNNTFVDAPATAGSMTTLFPQTGAVYENNAIQTADVCGGAMVNITASGASNFTNGTIDYNAYDSGITSCGAWSWAGVTVGNTLAGWQSITGFDAHTITPASLGLSSTSPFKPLSALSAVVKAGINLTSFANTNNVPELLLDRAGTTRPATGPWDIGAYQFAPAVSTTNTFIKKTPNSNKPAGSVFPLLMQLVDVNGNPIPNTTVTVAVTRGSGVISPTALTTDSNGMFSTTVTLDSNPGLNTFVITSGSAGYVLNVAGF